MCDKVYAPFALVPIVLDGNACQIQKDKYTLPHRSMGAKKYGFRIKYKMTVAVWKFIKFRHSCVGRNPVIMSEA